MDGRTVRMCGSGAGAGCGSVDVQTGIPRDVAAARSPLDSRGLGKAVGGRGGQRVEWQVHALWTLLWG